MKQLICRDGCGVAIQWNVNFYLLTFRLSPSGPASSLTVYNSENYVRFIKTVVICSHTLSKSGDSRNLLMELYS